MKAFEITLVWMTTALQIVVAVLIVRREFQKQFRIFFSYLVFIVAAQILGFIALPHPGLYFYFYWVTEPLSIVMTFFVLYEVFHWVFRSFRGFVWFRFLLPVMGILMLIIAGGRAMLLPMPGLDRLAAAMLSLEIIVGFLQVGIFVLFLFLVCFFHMRWRQYAFAIVVGFGISACGNLAVFLLRSEFGTKFNPIVEITPPIAYIIAVVVWLAALIPPQPDHPLKNWVPPLTPEEMLAEMKEYTRAVKGVLRR